MDDKRSDAINPDWIDALDGGLPCPFCGKAVPSANPNDASVRLIRALHALCPECDSTVAHTHEADGTYVCVRKSVVCVMARDDQAHAQCQQEDCQCDCHPFVCEACGMPGMVNADGLTEHAEYADAVACALFYAPRREAK